VPVGPDPIDLLHQGLERRIAVYLIETDDGRALVDCGPTTCVSALERGLAERGLGLADVTHLLLSHIHLDHAGAAGTLIRRHPRLRVHVSEVGAPHLVDPTRLERSARRIYGDTFDTLWGALDPVPATNVDVAGPRVAGLDCFAAPGHADHHVAYLHPDGTLFSGDAAGVRITPGRFIVPAAPPPDIDIDAWLETLDEIERRAPARLALTHFGVVEDPGEHLPRMREQLLSWSARVRDGMTEEEFVAAARRDLQREENLGAYDDAAPVLQTYAGLTRYWEKRAAA
jgi:glyoxylase-like metal-dependent hydrolase (beta-lactamase superfamily II)